VVLPTASPAAIIIRLESLKGGTLSSPSTAAGCKCLDARATQSITNISPEQLTANLRRKWHNILWSSRVEEACLRSCLEENEVDSDTWLELRGKLAKDSDVLGAGLDAQVQKPLETLYPQWHRRLVAGLTLRPLAALMLLARPSDASEGAIPPRSQARAKEGPPRSNL
jgi:hypothetical protein